MFNRKILAALVFCVTSTGTWSQAAPNVQFFRLELSPEKTFIRSHQDAVLELTIGNISKDAINLRTSGSGAEPEFFCEVLVKRSDGALVEETDYERRVKGHGVIALDYNSKFVYLKPGDRVQEHIELSKLFNLKPGSYLVQVKRPVHDLDTRGNAVTSNIVSLEVQP